MVSTIMVWLAYDLGINGDYEGMYAWLAKHKAKECGDSIALFSYEFNGNFIDAIKEDLQSAITLDKKSRIYIIRSVDGKIKARFIFGARRVAPWAGFATVDDQTEDTDE